MLRKSDVGVSRRGRAFAAKGFTLIELLLVLAIIAILATLVVPKFAGRTEQARITKAHGDISNIGTALRMFEIDCGRFPTTSEGLRALLENPGNVQGWQKPYIEGTLPKDPWGNDYDYRCPSPRTNYSYDLWSYGPDGQNGTNDDIIN